jgi:hypothetical protein
MSSARPRRTRFKTGFEISMSRTYSRLSCSVAAALALAIADHRNAAAQTHYATSPDADAPSRIASQPAPERPSNARRAWPPVVPVGLDAYRQWAMWPYQRIGVRAYMRSTYDRDGLNRTADASHFLYGERPDFNVTLDVLGRGILYFVRTNRWHGSPWHYEVDGIDHIVRETSTEHPLSPSQDSVFEPATTFPPPLAWTWPTTRGADLSWVPIPFERSLRLAYGRTFYGTGYYIHHQFVDGTPLSSPLSSFDLKDTPDPEVLALLEQSGTDIAPKDIARTAGQSILEPGQPLRLPRLEGSRMLRALMLQVPADRALELSDSRLRLTWDDRQEPSVDAPLALFFGAGVLFNRDNTENLVKAFPVNIRYVDNLVQLACYFPMPFFRAASVEIIPPPGLTKAVPLTFEMRTEPLLEEPRAVGYFHASYRDLGRGEPGKDHVLLDTRGMEGIENWSGSFIGTSITFTDRGELRTLEGDPRFFFDDAKSPQAQGTGTEEWGGGGDYWGGRTMSLPFVGHPVGAPSSSESHGPHDLVHSTYRFLLADLFPFGRNARIQFEHGGANDVFETYRAVTYWYGLPAATLVKSDELLVGNAPSESEHGYRSPDSTLPQTLTSRFDLGPDTHIPAFAESSLDPQSGYAEWQFDADAGTYFVYIRGRRNLGLSDIGIRLQFDPDMEPDRKELLFPERKEESSPDRIVPLDRYSWLNPAEEPRLRVTFHRSGRHHLRLQARESAYAIDQIWLSPNRQQGLAINANGRGKPAAGSPPGSLPDIVLDAATVGAFGGARIVEDPQASIGKALVLDPGKLDRVVVYPPEAKVVRYTRGTSEFRLKVHPVNHGVMLRRTFDYALPNQRATVSIADGETAEPIWEPAGIWYSAGSNTIYHSFPAGELDPPAPKVLTSNRRFREDEFLVPLRLTRGRQFIRVRIAFEPVMRPLLPGFPDEPSAWSEIQYDAYSWVEPSIDQILVPR